MDGVALGLWVLTALGGATMAAIWLAGGGPAEHRAGRSRISPARLGGHAGAAAAGLVLWLCYVVTDEEVWGVLGLLLLPVAGAIGFLMFTTWLAERDTAEPRPPEQRIPSFAVAAHGLFALVTIVAVIAALVL